MEGKRAATEGKRAERLEMKAVQQGKLVAMEGMEAARQGRAALEKASEHLDSQLDSLPHVKTLCVKENAENNYRQCHASSISPPWSHPLQLETGWSE